MKTRAIIILILLLLLLLGYFVIKTRSVQSDLRIAELKIETDSIKFYSQRLKDSTEIVKQAQIIATQKEAIKTGLIEKEKEIKKYNALVKYTQELEIKNTLAKFDTPAVLVRIDTITESIDTSMYLRIPQRFTYSDKWANYSGSITRRGVELDFFNTKISGELLIAYEKTGMFKSEPIVRLKTDNPYASTTAFSNVIIMDDPKFYNRLWFRAVECGVSFGLGYHFGSK